MPDQKDRLGDKLRKKEKAEEDSYFAEQDRLKVERLKQAGGTQAVLGLCPRCGVGLHQKEHHEVQIDECSKCGGIWLDQGELELLVEREDESWASRWLRSVLTR
jgi:hypothetical protein